VTAPTFKPGRAYLALAVVAALGIGRGIVFVAAGHAFGFVLVLVAIVGPGTAALILWRGPRQPPDRGL
jgi:hypothetical protein